jgi:hypothetical protein
VCASLPRSLIAARVCPTAAHPPRPHVYTRAQVKYTLKKLEQIIYELTLATATGGGVVPKSGDLEPPQAPSGGGDGDDGAGGGGDEGAGGGDYEEGGAGGGGGGGGGRGGGRGGKRGRFERGR